MRTLLHRLVVASALLLASTVSPACGDAELTSVDAIAADHLEVVRGDRRVADTTVDHLRRSGGAKLELGDHVEEGVPLAALLKSLEIELDAGTPVVAVGADGYQVELDATAVASEETVIVFAVDGDALPDHQGPLRLRAADRARSVRNLRRLILK